MFYKLRKTYLLVIIQSFLVAHPGVQAILHPPNLQAPFDGLTSEYLLNQHMSEELYFVVSESDN